MIISPHPYLVGANLAWIFLVKCRHVSVAQICDKCVASLHEAIVEREPVDHVARLLISRFCQYFNGSYKRTTNLRTQNIKADLPSSLEI